ncbi:uncharacterized protein LOC116299205 [Actinia tenebrosa]|uniref:Uncharacterized protein LOC116299205 n=1 Tax=Actinia tenebrosa TaxID=6105 RepID=A0A6P8ICV4_ACTTE|nr:uncharacterized protein LOC116299205 [Actinia tenebrosa]
MSGNGANVSKSELPKTSSPSFVPGANLYTDFASDSIPTPVQPVQTAMFEANQTTKETQGKGDKTSEEQHKRPNRKDWIDTENPLRCKPCNFVAQNIEEFQDHSLSYRHIKKTAEVLEMKVNSKKPEEKKKQTAFTCEICVCSCNSESAWNSHLVGQKHRKNLEKQGAAKMFQKQKMKYGGGMEVGGGPVYHRTLPSHGYKPYQKPTYTPQSSYSLPKPGLQCANDFAQYKEPLIGLEYVTEIQVTGQNPRYHCKLCDAKFDHNVKFPHLVGAKHRFNVLKEKNPAIAQEIRLGVKKRSELTGKLLDEAMKIEQQEGRQQVKTCVEASPFDGGTNNITQGSLLFQGSSPYSANTGGLGRGFTTPSRPYQKSPRGHPLKGPATHQNRAGQKRPPGLMNFQNQYESTTPVYGNNNQQYNSNIASFGTGPPLYQETPVRGRGGRGHGFRGTNQNYGRGYNNKQNRQTPGFTPTSTNTYQPNHPGFTASTPYNYSTSAPLLPREAFAPSTTPRLPPKYNNTQNSNSGQTGTTQAKRNDSPATTTQASFQPDSPSTESSQDLLQGLADLGKLVSSEEDASIALQVSNALTQALLKYRMQSIKEEQY